MSAAAESGDNAGAVTPSCPPLTHRPGTPPSLPETVIASILAELLSGLVAVCRTGRIQRDVKSDNTLAATEGRVQVGNCGFSAAVPLGGPATPWLGSRILLGWEGHLAHASLKATSVGTQRSSSCYAVEESL